MENLFNTFSYDVWHGEHEQKDYEEKNKKRRRKQVKKLKDHLKKRQDEGGFISGGGGGVGNMDPALLAQILTVAGTTGALGGTVTGVVAAQPSTKHVTILREN